MSVGKFVSGLFGRKKKAEKTFCSVVLLLRVPRFLTAEELRAAGMAGWGKRFDGEEDPMYFVVQEGTVTMLKAGSYVMHVLHSARPYLDDHDRAARQLPQPEQQAAWRAHTAWISFDLLNPDFGKPEAYAVLARLAQNFLDPDCVAVYLPGEQMLMPNDGTASTGVQFLLDEQLPFGEA